MIIVIERMRILAILIFLLILSGSASAETKELFMVKGAITYDETVEADEDNDGFKERITYYLNNQMVATTYDENKDGRADTWFTYDSDLRLDSISEDSDKDGKIDSIYTYTDDEKLLEAKTEKSKYLPPKWLGKNAVWKLLSPIGLVLLTLLVIKFKNIINKSSKN